LININFYTITLRRYFDEWRDELKAILFLTVLTALAVCQSQPISEMSYTEQKAWAKTIAQKCVEQGIGYDNPDFKACLNAESKRDAVTRYNNGIRRQQAAQALSEGFSNAGAAYSNAASSRTSTNCTSTRTPSGSVNTTCY
jgi:hypothetical protein